MVRDQALDDVMWAKVEPLLPPQQGRGRPWRDHRQVVEAIIWRFRTGSPWRDVPSEFGPWKTAFQRHDRWSGDGTWERVLTELQVDADAREALGWTVSVDSTVNRAHQHAAGARRREVEPAPGHTGGSAESQESGTGAG